MALDVFVLSGLAAAVGAVVALVKPLISSVLSKSLLSRSVEVNITVESPDGSRKKFTIENRGTEQLTEEQLKTIVKVLSEADSGR